MQFQQDNPSALNHFGKMMLHGNGTDRWFDKSFTLCVGTNGRMGANCEHSWADAPIISHLWEFLLGNDHKLGYDVNGNCRPRRQHGGPGSDDVSAAVAPASAPPRATKLRWEIPRDAREVFNQCIKVLL